MKKNILQLLLDLIFPVVFDTIFFMLGGIEHPASVWISYVFIHFSYIMMMATPLLTRKSSSSEIFGFSLNVISSAYFYVEFVVGTIFIFIAAESYKFTLLTQIIIVGIYAVPLLATMLANENTADSIERHENEVMFIKENSSRIKLLINKLSDKNVNKELEKLYDLLHSSTSKSIAKVKPIEIDVYNCITELERAVRAGNPTNVIAVCKNITALIDERNSILKISN